MSAYPSSVNVRRAELANGAVLLAYENRAAPSVVLVGSLAAGAQYEQNEPAGLASMTAQALMRGCAAYDFDELHERLEAIGADLQFSAGSHKLGFFGKALAEDLPILAETLAAVLRAPSFSESEIELLRDETLTTLRYYQQDTGWRAGEEFSRLLYPPGHPYHGDVIGQAESVEGIRAGDLRAFHERVYGPAGLVVTVVGAVDPDTAIDLLAAQLEDWRPAQQREPTLRTVPIPPLCDIREGRIAIAGKTQTDIVMGVAGPARFAEDFLAASIANSVLGQFGMMGRIGETVRERHGYSYYAYSRIEGGYDCGGWCVLAGVGPRYVESTLELLREEIGTMRREPISACDLADNQAYFKGRLPLQLETNEGIAGTLLTMECFALGQDYLREYGEHIDRITREDVLQAVQRYWLQDGYVLAIAGPESSQNE